MARFRNGELMRDAEEAPLTFMFKDNDGGLPLDMDSMPLRDTATDSGLEPLRGTGLNPVPFSSVGRQVVSSSARYIDALEKRVKLLEGLIRRVAPTVDINDEVGPSFDQCNWEKVKGTLSSTKMMQTPKNPTNSTPLSLDVPSQAPEISKSVPMTSAAGTKNYGSAAREAQEDSDNERNFAEDNGSLTKHLLESMKKLKLETDPPMERRFHGKSSAMKLLQAALELKKEPTDLPRENVRMKYWRPSPWEYIASFLPPVDSLRFPPPDLIRTLVNHCFDGALNLFPVIHRPSFERLYLEGQHRVDFNFARLLLMVCSVGARYCQDTRVCLTSPSGEVEWKSAGWVYFAQVYQVKKPLLSSAKLIDLQIMSLSAIFLLGTSAPYGAWLIVGIGLRFAQDIGANRAKVYNADHAFENQIWKRAFWSLVVLDKLLSSMFGRPICINDEDIDTHFPLEVDDEGWDDASRSWMQPVGKPSQLTYFARYAKLMGILEHAIKTVCVINKTKINKGFIGPEWEQHTVSELDSALNSWLDGIPDHLQWDHHMEPDFYQQAASLRLTFYYVQTIIHRPFIQLSATSKLVSPLSQSSLAICTHAARSSAGILRTATELPPQYIFVNVSLISGLVLLISIEEVRRSAVNADVSMYIADVHTCLGYLEKWENRYYFAGKGCDILRGTAALYGIHDAGSQQNTPSPTTSTSVQSVPAVLMEPSLSEGPSVHPCFTNGDHEILPLDASALQREHAPVPATRTGVTSSMQWDGATAPDMDNTLGQLISTRDSYCIADAGTGLQMMPGYATGNGAGIMSPNSSLQELFEPLAGSEQVMRANEPMVQSGLWNNEPTAQYATFPNYLCVDRIAGLLTHPKGGIG
ncbi:hypothetical protein FRB97_006475 [Tulasnella sp. 331]|nr:hypothetical protein FRB97_006475 [Tulasnella sp. 331]